MTTDYDQIAEQFSAVIDRIPGNQFYERPATISLLPPLKDIDVLDAGCGSGFYTEYAHKAGARVVAFDPSKGMVEQAIKRVGTGCDIHCCKSSDLDAIMAGRKFDLVLSNLVMHYVQDLKVEFSRLEQMLKTDGKMIVSMKHPSPWIFEKVRRRTTLRPSERRQQVRRVIHKFVIGLIENNDELPRHPLEKSFDCVGGQERAGGIVWIGDEDQFGAIGNGSEHGIQIVTVVAAGRLDCFRS